MSGFKPYPAYKDSGVEWLGEVPDHWSVQELKRGFSVTLGKMLQTEQKSAEEELLPYLRAINIQPEGVSINPVHEMWFSPQEKERLQLVKGDLLVSEGGDVGRSAIWERSEEMYIQNAINRVRPKTNNQSTKFLFYWMWTIKEQGLIEVICNKATIPHFTAEKVETVLSISPPDSEQTQIAQFLDHETARLDALAAEQQKLIELLKEKRQALISHAVTKGLDPNVPMKDSGVEWLGEVPEHWELFSLKRSVDGCTNGFWGSEPDGVDDLVVIRVADFNRTDSRVGTDKLTYRSITEKERASRLLQAGDLLIEKSGGGEKTLVGCVVLFDHTFEAVTSNFVARMRPLQGFDSGFLCYVFDSLYQGKVNFPAIKQTTGIQNLDSEAYLQEKFCFPPSPEQTQIAQFLDHETSDLDALVAEAEQAIELIKERRSTLISAAVTGKIDVRNWQAGEP